MSTQIVDFKTAPSAVPATRPLYLMCPPTRYDVDYVINPWMEGNLHAPSREQAIEQWRRLYQAVSREADVLLIEPVHGCPDMVFTANAGLEYNGTVVLSNFRHTERQAEAPYFRSWFQNTAYTVIEIPQEVPFEGEGDALFSVDGNRLWVASGPRTSAASHSHLADAWGVEVASLKLVDPRFYHLDTCFAPLEDGCVMFYPQAFDASSVAKIEAFYRASKRFVVSEADAVRFACNAINIGHYIIVNNVSRELSHRLESKGFDIIQVTLSEFLKAGGAAKCLVMRV